MLAVGKVLVAEKLDAKLLLQIHDELVFEVPLSQVNKTRALVQKAMESVFPLDVPLTVNMEVGTNLAKGE